MLIKIIIYNIKTPILIVLGEHFITFLLKSVKKRLDFRWQKL